MRKLLTYIFGVVVLVVVADLLLGVASDYYMSHAQLPGDYRSVDYVVRESRDDVLILGSSVALNSLIPTLLEDSLHTTCYNGAANGQQLPFYLTLLDCVLRRHTPHMIILGLTPDACQYTGLGDRYNLLAPYYDRGFHYVDSCMETGGTIERLKLRSHLLRYNTIWWRILLYHFVTPDNPGEKGFVAKPLPPNAPEMITLEQNDTMSAERRGQLAQLLDVCRQRHIELVVYFPPQYQRLVGTNACRDTTIAMCQRAGAICLDHSQDSTFMAHPEWFYDNLHLNGEGAAVYTAHFLRELAHAKNTTNQQHQ